MLPGRKLAHLEGMRFADLNNHQWWTYLTAKADPGLGISRRQRWKDALCWMFGDRDRTWGKPFDYMDIEEVRALFRKEKS